MDALSLLAQHLELGTRVSSCPKLPHSSSDACELPSHTALVPDQGGNRERTISNRIHPRRRAETVATTKTAAAAAAGATTAARCT